MVNSRQDLHTLNDKFRHILITPYKKQYYLKYINNLLKTKLFVVSYILSILSYALTKGLREIN